MHLWERGLGEPPDWPGRSGRVDSPGRTATPSDGCAAVRHMLPVSMTTRPTLAAVLRILRGYYGKPPAPISTDPFRLILWEQVAYLVPDSQRRKAYIALRTQVGVTPGAILAAPTARLVAICRLGGSIAAPARAARLRRSAELALGRPEGSLRAALRLPLSEARRALAAFPMIGEPGADKILVFSKAARLLPLDSNGLRVLQRLDFTTEAKDYRTAYRQAQAALGPHLIKVHADLREAYYLLRQHGQELCRRGTPRCTQCPLRVHCPVGRTAESRA
jgi:endonuclease III